MSPVPNRKSLDIFDWRQEGGKYRLQYNTYSDESSEKGIIELSDSCAIKEESIQAYQVFSSNLNISFTPIGNLTEFLASSHLVKLSHHENMGESFLQVDEVA